MDNPSPPYYLLSYLHVSSYVVMRAEASNVQSLALDIMSESEIGQIHTKW